MSLRGTGQGGPVSRFIEVFDVLGSSGILNPAVLGAIGKGVGKWGSTPAGGFAASAARRPNDVGLIDEVGAPLTFGEVDSRTNAIARGLAFAERGKQFERNFGWIHGRSVPDLIRRRPDPARIPQERWYPDRECRSLYVTGVSRQKTGRTLRWAARIPG